MSENKTVKDKGSVDLFTLEIIKDSLVAVGDEMFNALARTSMSPIIYETLDFAVGLTDAEGELLTQGDGVTLFLATLDTTVQEIINRYGKRGAIKPGDVFMTNDPYGGGGTHLSDVSIVIPVFAEEEIIGYTLNKAHWIEVGGKVPGSVCSDATEIFQEGLQFPYIKLIDAGVTNDALIALIEANVRLPKSTLGDMWAGVASARVGGQRLLELVDRYGKVSVQTAMVELLNYGELMICHDLEKLPDGVYEAEDMIENDGLGNGPFTLKVKITIEGSRVVADFTGTDAQAPGPVNCSYTGLSSAVRTLVKSLTNPDISANGGCFRPIEVICPEGTIFTAQRPAPTSIYYETNAAATDLMWKALAHIAPERLSAGHMRSICGTFVSGIHPDSGEFYILGEPLVGGWGAAIDADGQNGQFCCGDGETYNIPVELTESRYGIQVDQYAFHDESGGAGCYRGGKGVVLDYRITSATALLTTTFSRDSSSPWSLNGGHEGTCNYVQVLRNDGSVERHSMITGLLLQQGEVVRLITATGGGYGDPLERDRSAVISDIKNGYISRAEAEEKYGFAHDGTNDIEH